KGFSVVEALQSVGEYLIKFGGHDGAGGLSVTQENLPLFAAAFSQECEKRLQFLEINPFVEADTEVKLGEVTATLVKELENFAPFGIGNSTPQLLARDLKVLDVKILKNAHL